MPPGADAVIAAIPPEVCRPGTTPWVGLRRAIVDLLTGNPAKGIPSRTPTQVVARMNRCWYDGRGPQRSAPGYAPATTNPGDQPIRNRSSWLAAAILHQECADPKCEDGVIITTGRPCPDCAEARHEMAEAQRAVAAAEERRAAEEAALRVFDAEARANLWREILSAAYAEHERRERAAAERAERRARERAEDERLRAEIARDNPELIATLAARRAN
ncbi:IgA1 protease [Streptomyces malaysiensis subsp. malaysiensis]|nr:IgA1 protease [Streptomyces malaysiensis]